MLYGGLSDMIKKIIADRHVGLCGMMEKIIADYADKNFLIMVMIQALDAAWRAVRHDEGE